jgi:hypothetical protein
LLTPAASGGNRYGAAGVIVLASGRVLFGYWHETNTTGFPGEMFVRASDDDGATFSAAVAMGGMTESNAAGSHSFLQLANGDLLCTIFGRNTGDTTYRAAVMRSTDDGDSWVGPYYIGAANTGLNEASLVELPNGDVVAFARSEATNPGTIWRSVSTDDGVTWSVPTSCSFLVYPGMPTAAIFPTSQRLVLAYRRRVDAHSVYRWSDDYGVTWSDEHTLMDKPHEYAGLIALDGATLAGALGWDFADGQDSANPGRCDVSYFEIPYIS